MLYGGLLLAASVAQAGTEWVPSAVDLQKLERGEVLIFSDLDRDADKVPEKGDVRAAVKVNASAEQVFQTMTSCERALRFVPRLKHCKVLETAPDGSWQTVEHEVDGNGYVPRTRYVFRADYEGFARIRCTEVSGDFRENRGLWTFRPLSAGSAATLVTYTVHVVPRFYAPRWAVRASLKRELPVLMTAFRDVAQSPDTRATMDNRPSPQPRPASGALPAAVITRLN
jgi:ribosome-associated toxin RatA of RatAB toxin-antitoxin module